MRSSPFIHSEIRIRPSLFLLVSALLGWGVALGCVVMMPVPLLSKWVGISVLSVYLVWLLRQQGWWPYCAERLLLEMTDDEWFYHRNPTILPVRKLAAVKLTSFALFLRLELDSRHSTHLVLWRDSLPESVYKALYVAFKFNRFDENSKTQKLSGVKTVSLISDARSG
ncbi:MAG TPA: protein YgfX [Pseudomonadales bacterium]|nr:protein YgfX [Pseudomonadales bacterium]